VRVTIFVEGGGDQNDLRTKCRKGFRILLERAGFRGRMPVIVACGSRLEAINKFRHAIAQAGTEDFPILLVDSERPIRSEHREQPWSHLATAPDGWQRPSGATDDHAHLMVQCMESWFLADRDCLTRYFGPGLQAGSLPGGSDVEQVEKARVIEGLCNATRNCRKRTYHKGRHSFEILEQLDPARVKQASAHARRFFLLLDSKLASGPGPG
jgi:hypothetical protein